MDIQTNIKRKKIQKKIRALPNYYYQIHITCLLRAIQADESLFMKQIYERRRNERRIKKKCREQFEWKSIIAISRLLRIFYQLISSMDIYIYSVGV